MIAMGNRAPPWLSLRAGLVAAILLLSAITALNVDPASAWSYPQAAVKTPPVVTVFSPIQDSQTPSAVFFDFLVNHPDSWYRDGGVDVYFKNVTWQVDSSNRLPVTEWTSPSPYSNQTPGRFSFVVPGLPNGPHTMLVNISMDSPYDIFSPGDPHGHFAQTETWTYTTTVTFTVNDSIPFVSSSLELKIDSPLNQTYTTDSVPLNVTAYDVSMFITDISYTLDTYTHGQLFSHPTGPAGTHNANGTATLAGLSNGPHHLAITVDEWMFYTSRITYDVYFSVQVQAAVSPSSTLSPENAPEPPAICIVSPANGTVYETGNIPLTFTVTKPDSWAPNVGIIAIQYKLDPVFNGDFATETSGWTSLAPAQSSGAAQQYSLTVQNASVGNHSLMVRVTVGYPNLQATNGDYALFSVARAEPLQQQTEPPAIKSPSTPPTQASTIQPSQTPDKIKVADFVPVIIPAAIVTLGTAVALLVYFKRRR